MWVEQTKLKSLIILRVPNKDLQVQRIEEEDQVFAFIVGKRDVLEFSIYHCLSFEVWGWVLNTSCKQPGPWNDKYKEMSMNGTSP